ncbi:MAG: metalloregulator ArsR/SmtB family transcription factor [Pirellulales bacterium]
MSLAQIWDYSTPPTTPSSQLAAPTTTCELAPHAPLASATTTEIRPALGIVERLRLLGDETRWHIIQLLAAESRLNVTELCQRLRHSQPAVSHHLMLLRNAGLLEMRRHGKHNYYSLVHHACGEVVRELGTWLTTSTTTTTPGNSAVAS